MSASNKNSIISKVGTSKKTTDCSALKGHTLCSITRQLQSDESVSCVRGDLCEVRQMTEAIRLEDATLEPCPVTRSPEAFSVCVCVDYRAMRRSGEEEVLSYWRCQLWCLVLPISPISRAKRQVEVKVTPGRRKRSARRRKCQKTH